MTTSKRSWNGIETRAAKRRRQTLVASLAFSVACDMPPPSVPYTETDSLGINVITYGSSFESAATPTSSLDPEPQLIVGEPTVELYDVRAARFLSDGDVAVANAGSHEVLLFDAEGELRARIGGEGQGPGEFTILTNLSIGPGDSLYVFDGRSNHLSVFDANGVFGRSQSIAVDESGRLTDIVVLSHGRIVGAFHRRTGGTGLVRDSLMVVRYDMSGTLVDTIGTFPHAFTHWGPHSLSGEPGAIIFPAPVPLSPLTLIGAGRGILYIGLADRYELIRIDEHDNRQITRQQRPLPSITEEYRDRLFAHLAAGGRSGPEETLLRDLTGPTTLPAFGDEPLTQGYDDALIVTDAGGLWVRPFRLDDATSNEWPRFGPDGRYEGAVMVPSNFRPTDVRGNVVVGVHRDSLDVESVRAFRVVERH